MALNSVVVHLMRQWNKKYDEYEKLDDITFLLEDGTVESQPASAQDKSRIEQELKEFTDAIVILYGRV